MIKDELTDREEKCIIALRTLAPKLGVLPDFGYYKKGDKIFVRSNGVDHIIEMIELIQKIKLVPVEGNLAELKIK